MKLQLCSWCEGGGDCPTCGSGRFDPIVFDLGPTRTYPKGRQSLWNPGRGELTVTRGKKRTDYRIHEFVPDRSIGEPGSRAFACVKLDRFGNAAETYHVEINSRPCWSKCSCAGFLSESTRRGDDAAWENGGPVTYGSLGCLHVDACFYLVCEELLVHSPVEMK